MSLHVPTTHYYGIIHIGEHRQKRKTNLPTFNGVRNSVLHHFHHIKPKGNKTVNKSKTIEKITTYPRGD